ncbi:MAG TPA: hypothetical protein VGJ81_22065 [Thermoanaerobaculia bacterium]|jgi:hypothetical protein
MPLLPILLAVAARDLFLPVAGRIHDPLHDVRTTVTLRNSGAADAHATIRFVPTAGTARQPPLEIVIPPNATRAVDPFGETPAIGAIRITSDQPIVATGRIANGRIANGRIVNGRIVNGRIVSDGSSATFDAMSSADGITGGDAAKLGGFTFDHAIGATNRLYVVETAGDALQYTTIILGADGNVLGQKLHLIHPFEQHSHDLDADFPGVAVQHASILLRGMNGGGCIVAEAAITARSNGAITARAMKVTERHERGLSNMEKLAYAAIALFIAGAALRSRR